MPTHHATQTRLWPRNKNNTIPAGQKSLQFYLLLMTWILSLTPTPSHHHLPLSGVCGLLLAWRDKVASALLSSCSKRVWPHHKDLGNEVRFQKNLSKPAAVVGTKWAATREFPWFEVNSYHPPAENLLLLSNQHLRPSRFYLPPS